MYKPTKTFKMPKYVKRRMATITSDEMRNHYRAAMTQAVLQSQDLSVGSKEARK